MGQKLKTYSSRLWLPYVKLFRLWNFYDLFRPPSTFELFVLTILRLNSKLPIEEGNFQILIRQRLEHADADRYQANLKKVYNKSILEMIIHLWQHFWLALKQLYEVRSFPNHQREQVPHWMNQIQNLSERELYSNKLYHLV